MPRAGAVAADSMQVMWTDNSSSETFFQVAYTRLPVGSAVWQSAAVGPNRTSEALLELLPDTQYGAVVRACNAAGCSAWSDSVTGRTSAVAPSPTAAGAAAP